jgi:hypothetical protein
VVPALRRIQGVALDAMGPLASPAHRHAGQEEGEAMNAEETARELMHGILSLEHGTQDSCSECEQAIVVALTAARRAAMEEAAKLMCPNCRDGAPFHLKPNDWGRYHTPVGHGDYCPASPIWRELEVRFET